MLTILAAQAANADGSAVLLTTAESGAVLASAERPGVWADLQAWVADGGKIAPQPLGPLKEAARVRINAARDAAIAAGITFAAVVYDSDTASREALTATLTVLQPVGAVPQGFTWRAADNTDHALTLAQLQGLAAAMLDHGYAQHLKARQKKALIETAQSAAEVAAVVWAD